ncbi:MULTISPECIES: hypothetical protein [Bacillaceae]|uniref:hypothetical protein n=1 Tax=Bacillaceae TaxID=186817 RepID=UPI001E3CD7C1|nr:MULTISPECIES: hypothetical protein [Bacillaceae]MCE4047335.1 hypothetical protein [Bacillus sp. Au-Bac7]MDL0437135.1 hypothetical protein [Niallia sp. SS-2023]UPO86306.1 hypothetical protein L8T27_011865 [Niallia sp. Man26]
MFKKRKFILFVAVAASLFMVSNVHAETKENAPITYGIQLLEWKEADKVIPRYSKFSIYDMETGKLFHAQRRAGSQHADVQPLTTADTKIMKEIYGGKWSWKRRSILVLKDDQVLAASMHGMPHGAGALQNKFPGHFCIHFLGSTTHKTDNMDLSHKLMVYKAAGILKMELDKQDPNDTVRSFVAGMKEQDNTILNHLSTEKLDWRAALEELENVKLFKVEETKDYQFETVLHINLEWQLYIQNEKRKSEMKRLTLVRTSPIEPWKVLIDDEFFPL